MKRMEVRNARDFTQLIGSLPVPDSAKVNDHIPAVVMKPRRSLPQVPAYLLRSPPRIVTLHVQRWWHDGHGGFAIAAGADLPLETLRLIPGFIEAGAPTLASLTTKEKP